jgi:hypothetical protein
MTDEIYIKSKNKQVRKRMQSVKILLAIFIYLSRKP